MGELKRELIATLRHAHNKRVPRSNWQDRRGQIPDMVSIHMRPPEIEARQFPGHWEGGLINGAANASAVGTRWSSSPADCSCSSSRPCFKPASALKVSRLSPTSCWAMQGPCA